MTTSRQQVQHLIGQGAVSSGNVEDALFVMEVWPDGSGWRRFIDLLLLWVGGLALAFAVMFFVAYNWAEMGRFAKFGLLEAGVAIATIAFWVLGDKPAGKVSLLVAAILLGVLLAYFGQTYQTGADPWELFFNWGLLILPWAMIGRFAALWILWALLGNLTLILYHQAFSGMASMAFSNEMGMFWQLFLFNSFVLAAWEISRMRWRWLGASWAIRLLAIGSGAPITWLVLHAIVETDFWATWSVFLFAAFAWAIWLAVMYLVYRRRRHDLFMLAGCCLSGIVVVSTGVGRVLLEDIGGDELASIMLLLLAMVVLGLGAAAAVWLKKVKAAFEDLKKDPVQSPFILEDLEIHGVTQLGDSAVTLRVRIKTLPGKQWGVGREYNRLVKKHFDPAGIEIPYPHMTLYFGQDKNGTAPPAPLNVIGDAEVLAGAGSAGQGSVLESPREEEGEDDAGRSIAARQQSGEKGDFSERS